MKPIQLPPHLVNRYPRAMSYLDERRSNPGVGRKARIRISEHSFGYVAAYEEVDLGTRYRTTWTAAGESRADAIVRLVEGMTGEDY